MSPGPAAPRPPARPGRILMTLDAVGGVWRYAMDLAAALRQQGVETVFAIFGPAPSADQLAEARAIGSVIVADAPLDWTTTAERDLEAVPRIIGDLAAARDVDLVHLNLPSQAFRLELPIPVIAVSHSCVVTWFRAVRGSDVPPEWAWQKKLNSGGLAAADLVLAPSAAHAGMLVAAYGAIAPVHVVHNAVSPGPAPAAREPFVFAAGRWWDEGKNAAVLDGAAARTSWPVRLAGPLQGPAGQAVALRHAESLGALAAADVRAMMARAAIFASPSLYEPFGLSALEAAAGGAALVLADIPTYRELWDGAAAFADPRDPEAFAAAIENLAGDHRRRRELADIARARAARFTPAAQAEAMLRHYATAIDARAHRRRLAS